MREAQQLTPQVPKDIEHQVSEYVSRSSKEGVRPQREPVISRKSKAIQNEFSMESDTKNETIYLRDSKETDQIKADDSKGDQTKDSAKPNVRISSTNVDQLKQDLQTNEQSMSNDQVGLRYIYSFGNMKPSNQNSHLRIREIAREEGFDFNDISMARPCPDLMYSSLNSQQEIAEESASQLARTPTELSPYKDTTQNLDPSHFTTLQKPFAQLQESQNTLTKFMQNQISAQIFNRRSKVQLKPHVSKIAGSRQQTSPSNSVLGALFGLPLEKADMAVQTDVNSRVIELLKLADRIQRKNQRHASVQTTKVNFQVSTKRMGVHINEFGQSVEPAEIAREFKLYDARVKQMQYLLFSPKHQEQGATKQFKWQPETSELFGASIPEQEKEDVSESQTIIIGSHSQRVNEETRQIVIPN